jgi:drug/metabolite transporter (DMT)-like permease
MMPPRKSGISWLYDSPYLLLVLPPLLWSGNFIVARAVHDTVPPVALAFWRWFGGFLVVSTVAAPHLRRDWPVVLRHWPVMLLLSATGIAAYNTFVYVGLGSTTALNALLMQSTMPVIVVLCSLAFFGERPKSMQIVAVAISLLGVVTIVTRGEPWAVTDLALNRGDLWIFAAVVAYALYSALLRLRPPIHPLSFLASSFLLGAAMLLPLYLREHAGGAVLHLDTASLLAVAYVAVLPSVLAYFCWNRGIELIGANRGGQFMHLMPVFGSVLAILLLGETFHAYHAAGAALIFAGIVLATRGRR